MSLVSLIKNANDTYVAENTPNTPYGASKKLFLGTSAGTTRYAYIYFALPIHRGANVLSAKLRLYNTASWSGSVTMTAQRTSAKWSSTRLTWNNRPGVTGTAHQLTKSGAAANTKWEIDVMSSIQAIANGGTAWYGFRIDASGTAYRKSIWAANSNGSYRPQLEVTWSDKPDAPVKLFPQDGQAVDKGQPYLDFDFNDPIGDGTMNACQVQVHTSDVWTAPAYDSGTVFTAESQLDLSRTDLPGGIFGSLAEDAVRWWRVRVQDGSGNWSAWSRGENFVKKAMGTLTLLNPGTDGAVQRTNFAYNPRAVGTYSPEYLNRYGWTTTWVTGATDLPEPLKTMGITTYNRQTAPAGENGVSGADRGVDLYANADVAPATTGNAILQPVSPGESLSMSAWMRGSKALPSARLAYRFHDGQGNWVSSLGVTSGVNLAANAWGRVAGGTIPVPAGARYVVARLGTGGTAVTWATGDTLDFTGILIERNNPLGSYFDGGLTDGYPNEYAWKGTAHQSRSTTQTVVSNLHREPRPNASTPGWSAAYGTGGAGTGGWFTGGPEGTYYEMTWTTAPTSGTSPPRILAGPNTNANTFAEGDTIKASMWVWSPTAETIYFTVDWQDAAQAWISSSESSTAILASTWTKITISATAPANTNRAKVFARRDYTTIGVGEKLRATAVMIANGSVLPDFFDGNTADPVGYDNFWIGTEYTSESRRRAIAYTTDATPTISWSFTGQTQKHYQVIIVEPGDGNKTRWDTGKVTSTATSFTVPKEAKLRDDTIYEVVLRVWDSLYRAKLPGSSIYVQVRREFLLDSAPDVTPVFNLVATDQYPVPRIKLTWDAYPPPDRFEIYRNNALIETDLIDDFWVSGDSYEYTDMLPPPYTDVTYKVVPVVTALGRAKNNPTVTENTRSVTTCLSKSDGGNPCFFLNADVDMDLVELDEVVALAGDVPPVLISHGSRGFEGSVTGILSGDAVSYINSQQMLERFKSLKKKKGEILYLTILDQAFECFIYNATFKPLKSTEGVYYEASFSFAQTDF